MSGGLGGLITRFPFTLPRGLVDAAGGVHREGVMRLATARDELSAQADARVRSHPAYAGVLLLASTIENIGGIDPDPPAIEALFASDLAFLQDLYRRINANGTTEADVRCPHCGQQFVVDVAGA